VTITSSLAPSSTRSSKAPQIGWSAARTIEELIGAAGLRGLLVIETRNASPIVPFRIFACAP
jgi:hypothetical protein